MARTIDDKAAVRWRDRDGGTGIFHNACVRASRVSSVTAVERRGQNGVRHCSRRIAAGVAATRQDLWWYAGMRNVVVRRKTAIGRCCRCVCRSRGTKSQKRIRERRWMFEETKVLA